MQQLAGPLVVAVRQRRRTACRPCINSRTPVHLACWAYIAHACLLMRRCRRGTTHTHCVASQLGNTQIACTHNRLAHALPCFPTLQTLLGSKRGKQRGVYQMQGGSGGGRGLGWYRGVTLGRRCRESQQRRGSNEIARARRGGRDRLNHTNTSTKTIGHSFSHRWGDGGEAARGHPSRPSTGRSPAWRAAVPPPLVTPRSSRWCGSLLHCTLMPVAYAAR